MRHAPAARSCGISGYRCLGFRLSGRHVPVAEPSPLLAELKDLDLRPCPPHDKALHHAVQHLKSKFCLSDLARFCKPNQVPAPASCPHKGPQPPKTWSAHRFSIPKVSRPLRHQPRKLCQTRAPWPRVGSLRELRSRPTTPLRPRGLETNKPGYLRPLGWQSEVATTHSGGDRANRS